MSVFGRSGQRCRCDGLMSFGELHGVLVELRQAPPLPQGTRVERSRAYTTAQVLGLRVRRDRFGRECLSVDDAVRVVAAVRADRERNAAEQIAAVVPPPYSPPAPRPLAEPPPRGQTTVHFSPRPKLPDGVRLTSFGESMYEAPKRDDDDGADVLREFG